MTAAAVGAPAKATTKSKKPRSYPTYQEMVTEAILALKERTGSSQIAIAKFIEEKQKKNLPANFKKLLLVQLKKLIANGKLVKVKNSFKLPPKTTSYSSSGSNHKPPAKNPPTATPKSGAVKRKAGDKPNPARKAAKTVGKKSPGKKAAVVAANKKATKKKPKSIKSPGKKAAAVKKAKK